MSEMVREEEFLGNKKVLVGSNKLDLVLEAFGNIYVKTGDSTKTLDELLKSIGSKTAEEVVNTTTILDTYANLVSLVYPGDGMFIYVKSNTTLYLTAGGEYLPIISTVGTDNIQYVKKTGDTMTGSLEVNTTKVPFIINSKKRVNNLNVQYLDGQTAGDFANKSKSESITGSWNFTNTCNSDGKWLFNQPVTHNADIVSNKSLGSRLFASGFGGYGWRLDGTTNTFTIDYLVVRKAMQIYELVVNKITATNGSLWVTNCATLGNTQPILGVSDFIQMDTEIPITWQNGSYYILQIDNEDTWILIYIKDKTSLQNLITEVSGDLSLLLSITKPTAFTEEQWSSFQSYITVRELHTNYEELINAKFEFISTTPLTNYSTYGRLTGTNLESRSIYSYYFTGEFYYIEDTNSEYSVLQVGDIIRCQKFENNSIKYYDAVIVRCFGSCKYVIRLVESVFDVYTEISYNDDGSINESTTSTNSTLYNKNTESNLSASLASVSDEDDVVQIGNIYNERRQGSVYITSSDDNAPYLQCMDGVNIPDFSVVYTTPQYLISSNGDYYYTTVTITNELTEYTIQTTKPNNSSLPIIERENWSIITENSVLKYKKDTTKTSFNYLHTTKSTVKVRLGKLEGIYNSLFGTKQPKGYGLYCDNVYMTGEFYLNNGTSIVEFSKEQILLQFKDAGITITDGQIVLDASKIQLNNGTTTAALFENGKIKAGYIDATGLLAHTQVAIGEYVFVDQNSSTIPDITSIKKHIGSIKAELKAATNGYALRDTSTSTFTALFNSSSEKITAATDCVTIWKDSLEAVESLVIQETYINSLGVSDYGIPAVYNGTLLSTVVNESGDESTLKDYLLRFKISLQRIYEGVETTIGEISYDALIKRHNNSGTHYQYEIGSSGGDFTYHTYTDGVIDTTIVDNVEVETPKVYISIPTGAELYYKLDMNVMYLEDAATKVITTGYVQDSSATNVAFSVSEIDLDLFYSNHTEHPLLFLGTMSCFYTDGYFVYKDPFNYTYYKECDSSGNGLFESRTGNSVLDSGYNLTCTAGSLTGFKTVISGGEAKPMQVIVNDATNGLKYYTINYTTTNAESITTSYAFVDII